MTDAEQRFLRENGRTQLTRKRDLFRDPGLLKRYLAEHCATHELDLNADAGGAARRESIERYVTVPPRSQGLKATLCVNATYFDEAMKCDPVL